MTGCEINRGLIDRAKFQRQLLAGRHALQHLGIELEIPGLTPGGYRPVRTCPDFWRFNRRQHQLTGVEVQSDGTRRVNIANLPITARRNVYPEPVATLARPIPFNGAEIG